MTKLEIALALAARGFKVFPIREAAKAPPMVSGWPEKATTDQDQITRWWMGGVEANIGIHCEGLLVIDVDVKKGGDLALEKLEMLEDLDIATLTTRTPSGGRHLFYRLPEGHPGVPNGVDVLGPGLDMRSTGGYVVAPGSQLENGRYRFENGGTPTSPPAILPAPEWLVQKLGVSTKREPNSGVNKQIPDAPDDVLERARVWLEKHAERSVKGQGGDQAAYRVACQLRDMGVSEAQACELMRSDAWDSGCGWRAGWLEAKPIHSAYRYATGEPGTKGVSASAFEAADPGPIQEQAAARSKGKLQSMDELADSTAGAGEYLVKGLLSRRSYAEVFAPPGAGKTFIALDLAYHVAAGKEWHGRKVRQGPALYLPYEGRGGFAKRVRALRQHYQAEGVPLFIAPQGYNLRTDEGQRGLLDAMSEMPAPPALIVIDTLAHALCGGDENSAQDVGAFNSAVESLVKLTGACVLVLHHPTKAGGVARGSGALQGAVDTELEIEDGRLIARKQRDVELAEPIGFALKPVVLGQDEDGDAITSCVVVPAQVPKSRVKVAGDAQLAWDVLLEIRPDNAPVSMLEWKQACCERFLKDANDTARKKMFRYKQTLKLAGRIVENDGMISRRLE